MTVALSDKANPAKTSYAASLDAAPLDEEELKRVRAARIESIGRWVVPLAILVLSVWLWDRICIWNEIPHYILPRPGLVFETLLIDWPILWVALLNTLKITFGALFIATAGGLGLAVLFTQSKWIEISFFPFAVILQVTPIIAIAPLILIYVDSLTASLLICAWIVAFFPILSNTVLGLNSADHNLRNLFQLYGASRWQTLRYLRLPAAMPYFLGGLKIAGGLSLIGAIVAEFVAGSAGSGSGLANQILEASYRLNMPRMFAALLMISVTGILIFLTMNLLSHLLLRKWHESALKREV
ncbi:ABC transporter permease [uncultured Roseibium sp.]|uniref:ABC transporter permease n=1 Tax=uncultured Roseibium sp. TaxID=1936171 RepID=UPI00261746D1|nr:ABC transporter permease [uncultured Roseibium sp.]